MVVIQMSMIWFLIVGVVPSEALQDDTGIKKNCEFEGSSFIIERILKNKTEELPSCQDVCDANDKCLIWRDQYNSCNLTVYDIKKDKDRMPSGIANCGQISDKAISCEAQDDEAFLKKTKVPGKKNKEACQTSCNESETGNCLLWEYTDNKKANRCKHFKLKVKPNADSTFGIRYCSNECFSRNYNVLSDPSRSVNSGDGTFDGVRILYCDCRGENKWCDTVGNKQKSPGWQGEGWYRLTGEAGSRIPEKTANEFRCGTTKPGYVSVKHPTSEGESISAKFCFDDTVLDKICYKSTQGKITNCGDFYVYYLKEVSWCAYRYCATNDF